MSAQDLLAGAVDLHVHTGPDVVERRYTDVALAHRAVAHGLAGVVLKSHIESTVGRAAAAAEATGARVLGGLVLNRHTSGGLDPVGVAFALRQGARVIWLPTLTSPEHAHRFDGGPPPTPWLTSATALPLCREVARAGAVIATGHAGHDAVWTLAAAAAAEGARLLVSHADYAIPALDVGTQVRLAERFPDLWFERCAYAFDPRAAGGTVPLARAAEAIAATGGERHNVISSDLGQPEMPEWPAGLAAFAARLVGHGLPEATARALLTSVPARLVGLAPAKS
jgi:hypothetical protein